MPLIQWIQQNLLSKPNITYIGSGTLTLSGTAVVTYVPKYSYTSSGSLILGGSSVVSPSNFVYSYTASGTLLLNGSAVASSHVVFTYNSTGFNIVGPFSFPALSFSGSADVTQQLALLSKSFTWNILNTLEFSQAFTWNVGQGVLSVFRVVGQCKPTVCPPISDSSINVCNKQFITNIMAHSVSEVCEKLAQQGFNWPISSIEQFSLPFYKKDIPPGTDTTCNKLIDLTNTLRFTAPCLPFLAGYNAVEHMGLNTILTLIQIYNSTGSLSLSGQSIASFSNAYTSSGSLGLSGSAKVTSSGYSYISSGGLILSGSTNSASSNYYYSSSGGLVLSGRSGVLSNNYTYSSSGSLFLTGNNTSSVTFSYLGGGELDIIGIAGVSLSNFVYNFVAANGVLSIGGNASFASSYYSFSSSG